MSFTNPGVGWLGGITTETDTLTEAITWTHLMGINPGGEVAFIGFRADWVDPQYVDRLITDPTEWAKQPPPVNFQLLDTPLSPELIGAPPL